MFMEFVKKFFMADLVKSLAEVQHYEVSLCPHIIRSKQIIDQHQELKIRPQMSVRNIPKIQFKRTFLPLLHSTQSHQIIRVKIRLYF